jgi:type IX secretion system PorP/SprF family membrane protein
MKIFKLFILVLVLSNASYAQQGRNFSMWFHNNMQHNPAAVGTNDNDLQLFTNFRYQYFTVTDKPFQTISGSIEGKLFRSKNRNGYFGLGANFMNDMSGDGRYSNTQITIPIAYHLFINKDNFISLGISPGIYQRSINFGDYTWESQWNGYEFDNTFPSDNIAVNNFNFFNLGAGVFYNYKLDYTKRFHIGLSAQHLLEPQLTPNFENTLYRRITAQAGGTIKFDYSNFGLSPQFMAMFQGPNRNIMIGTNFDWYLKDPSLRTTFYKPTIFSFGIYHRIQDAIVVNFQYSTGAFTVALAYDSNINSMYPASRYVGAAELLLKFDIITDKKGKYVW